MSDEKLWGEKVVGFASGTFGAVVDKNVLQRKWIIGCDANGPLSTELDAAVVEQDVLASAVVIDTVEG